MKLRPRTQIILKRTSEEILPLLLGMELLWRTSPQQFLAKFPNQDIILDTLRLAGYIRGTEMNWEFTDFVYETAKKNLLRTPAIERKQPSSAPVGVVPSLTKLVLELRALYKKLPQHELHHRAYHIAPGMRLLCRKHSPIVVSAFMAEFIQQARAGDKDYTLAAMDRFITKRKKLGLKKIANEW